MHYINFRLLFVVVVVVSTLMFTAIQRVDGEGRLYIKLVRYSNPTGKGDNGHCCDGKSIFCESGGGCDHFFTICIDSLTGSDSMTSCPIGKRVTGSTPNQQTIAFGMSIGGTANPVEVPFSSWEAGVLLKVQVWDDDGGGGSDDLVDFMKRRVYLSPAPSSELPRTAWTSVSLTARTTLTMELRAICDDGWYGASCDVYCIAQSRASGHYGCSSTGQKICHRGWTGVNCATNINECASSPCAHGQCEDLENAYVCICQDGFSGARCNINDDDCTSQSCGGQGHGRCVDGVSGYRCECVNGWTGTECESDVDDCASSPCGHGGICVDMKEAYRCLCQRGWTGVNCTVDPCTNQPCQHGASCFILNDNSHNIPDDYAPSTSPSSDFSTVESDNFFASLSTIGPRKKRQSANEEISYAMDPNYVTTEYTEATTDSLSSITSDLYCRCTEKFTGRYCEQEVAIDDNKDEQDLYPHHSTTDQFGVVTTTSYRSRQNDENDVIRFMGRLDPDLIHALVLTLKTMSECAINNITSNNSNDNNITSNNHNNSDNNITNDNSNNNNTYNTNSNNNNHEDSNSKQNNSINNNESNRDNNNTEDLLTMNCISNTKLVVTVQYNVKTCNRATENKPEISEFIFHLSLPDGARLQWSTVRSMFNPTVLQGISALPESAEQCLPDEEAQATEENTDGISVIFNNYWLIILAVCAAFIVIAVISGILIYRRRTTRKETLYPSISNPIYSAADTSATLPPFGDTTLSRDQQPIKPFLEEEDGLGSDVTFLGYSNRVSSSNADNPFTSNGGKHSDDIRLVTSEVNGVTSHGVDNNSPV